MRSFVSKRVAEIPPSGIRVIFEMANKIPGVIRMEVGEPDFDTPKAIGDAAKRAIDEGFTHYTSSAGIQPLREAIASKLKKDNQILVDPSQVVVTPGAGAALYMAMMCGVNPGDEVLIPDPGWPHYEACVKLVGGKPVRYPTHEDAAFRPDPSEIAKLVTRKTTTIVTNTPSNPMGSVLERKDLRRIADIAEAEDLLVIADEVYEKVIYDGAKHESIASFDGMGKRTVTLNAASKTYAMTGWRVGYAAGPEEIVSQMVKLNLFVSGCATSIAQKAALAAFTGPQTEPARMLTEYSKRRDLIVKRLNEIPGFSCSRPGGAFYAFPRAQIGEKNAYDTSIFLLEKARVATVPGSAFGKLGEDHLRFSYATAIDKISEAMDRIEAVVKGSGAPRKGLKVEARSRS